ncbi:hypothetical protein AQZ52_16150 [Novosphingobium fuchskuhlense]|uniref:DUF4139 domain-containing protein n=1 Tax=Novosphingobium fuchskuhlense TaxID=1117702 RepID=A0A124JTN0_9SPHN|nr:hypothetical protein AQZ52_16150 [Novosphingobium fuchskuhlense]
MRRALSLLGLLALVPGAARGADEATVLSAKPDAVGVTIYRAPDRAADTAMNLGWLEGYALITETRTVDIPAGGATIRFEGVAGGILPESALVTGLPAGVREKNLDADLLSARNLYARAYGRPVILRRHRGKDGKGTVSEERAVIRSAADGAAIVQTRQGFEVANCGRGITDTLAYTEMPDGLSAKPTLSVRTESTSAKRATITLSYLAWGFDWQTNYVVQLNPETGKAAMTAWVTLASSDPTSFVDAGAAVVGGKLDREDAREDRERPEGDLVLHCYLGGHAQTVLIQQAMPAPAPPISEMEAPLADIIVTARRADEKAMAAPVKVTEEGLGDLKLYRVPMPTTVAAHAQKQVAMHDLKGVKFTTWHTADLYDDLETRAQIKLRTRNRREDGLGIPLPGGPVAVFEPQGENMLVVGQGGMRDYAVNEDVEVTLGLSPQVAVAVVKKGTGSGWRDEEAKVTNANPWPITFEGSLRIADGEKIERPSSRLPAKFGRPTWTVRVPANAEARLTYRVRTPTN